MMVLLDLHIKSLLVCLLVPPVIFCNLEDGEQFEFEWLLHHFNPHILSLVCLYSSEAEEAASTIKEYT